MLLCTSVVIFNVHGQVMGIFAWHAPLIKYTDWTLPKIINI